MRILKIEELRERLAPTTFDGWVCLGGDYRDRVEVQEWASKEEYLELTRAYTKFRNKMVKRVGKGFHQ